MKAWEIWQDGHAGGRKPNLAGSVGFEGTSQRVATLGTLIAEVQIHL